MKVRERGGGLHAHEFQITNRKLEKTDMFYIEKVFINLTTEFQGVLLCPISGK